MLEKLGNYQDAFDILLKEFQANLELVCVPYKYNVALLIVYFKQFYFQYCQNQVSENASIHSAMQLAGICRRSAGNLDWMPLVETILQTHSNSNDEKGILLVYLFIFYCVI